jgi:hypothetical protein
MHARSSRRSTPVIVAMTVIAAIVLAFCLPVTVAQIWRHRTPKALRGDWWADFERQFRAHAAEAARRRLAQQVEE